MANAMFGPLAFLERQGLADAGGLRAESLPGGYQNEVYRIRGEGIDWVVKRFSPSADVTLFPNLPQAEAMALQRLAAHNVAPHPISFTGIEGEAPVLVYEFYVGHPWSGGVASVAGLLRVLANVDGEGFRAVPMSPGEILAQGDSFLTRCTTDARQRLMARRPKPVEMAVGPRRLIHTDFGPGNLIEGADGLKAIDWQCPAAGDPAEDLAAFLSPAFQILYSRAPLTSVEEAELLEAYDDAETIERLRKLRPCFDWRMAAYCAMRQVYWAALRPEASERYRQSTSALLERLGA